MKLTGGRYRQSQVGFSLIELLVVLLIIGLGFSAVNFKVGGNSGFRLRIEAKQFANSTALIAEEAVLSNQQWGVDIYRQMIDGQDRYGYRWMVRSDDNEWQLASADREEVDFLFSPNIVLQLELEGSDQEVEIKDKREIVEQDSVIVEEKTVIDELTDPEEEQEEPVQPALWLLSSGEISAFKLTLYELANPDNQVVVNGDELGRIALETGVDEYDE